METPVTHNSESEYKFDWPLLPDYDKDTFTEYLKHLKGCPDLKYLEIGVAEGQSLLWQMDNILTHPTSRAIAIENKLINNLPHNIEVSGYKNKIELLIGDSKIKLKELAPHSFDYIFIDGDHRASSVFFDASLTWDLLKDNGILILLLRRLHDRYDR